jgi:hypothetical protein
LKQSELPHALAQVRELTRTYLSGKPEAFEAARFLLNHLLSVTVKDQRHSVRYSSLAGQKPNTKTLGVRSQPLLLNDGRYLRLMLNLSLDEIKDAPAKLRVYSASYQYQMDEQADRWIFRYDYVRVPQDVHPSSHVQFRAEPIERGCLPDGKIFERLHFPTGRVTLEAVIRCLVEQFDVPCHEESEIWRPILAESEREFEKIAHRPLSGPKE